MGNQLTQRPQSPRHPNNIRKAIERSCWKFYQVAEETQIPRETLVDYCAGKYPVPYERLQALAAFLNCPPDYLVPPLPNVRDAYWSHSQSGEAKDLEVLLVLRTYCQQHPIDENALQQFMELLGKVGRYREIEQCYERFLTELKKEDIWRKPDAYTTELLHNYVLNPLLLPPQRLLKKGNEQYRLTRQR